MYCETRAAPPQCIGAGRRYSSALGDQNRRNGRSGAPYGFQRSVRGFTLLEVLVVAVLIAVLATIVSVKLAPDDRSRLREEAARLAILLTQARDEAIATGSPIGWRGSKEGYQFYRRADDRAWHLIERDDAFHARAFAAPIRLIDLDIGAQKAPAEHLIVMSPAAANPPFRILLGLNDARVAVRADSSAQLVIENAN